MANIYVRSTDGNNSDDGSTWALAKATLAGALAIDAAEDTIYVSQAHNESSTGVSAFGAPNIKIIGASDASEPPSILSTAPTVATAGVGSGIFVTGNYIYGINFIAGDSSNSHNATLFGLLDTCSVYIRTTANNYAQIARAKNCTFRFSAAGQHILLYESGGPNVDVYIRGCSFHASTVSPTVIFKGGYTKFLIEGCDFSNLSSTVNLHEGGSRSALFRNCKLPASWSGSLINASVSSSVAQVAMYNCDSGDTNYRLWIEQYAGTIRDDTGIYNNAGATDGTTRISWKLVSNTNTRFPTPCLTTDEIVRWNETTGSSITVGVECVLDSATALNDDDIWVQVQYLGTSGYPISTFINDAKADVFATASAQASSSASWIGTGGFSNEQKRTLSVTFTPQEKGLIRAVVCLAKASTTLYVDPKLSVTY